MKKLIYITIFIFSFSIFAFAQDTEKEKEINCPTISVTPSPTAVRPGELQTFTANVVWQTSETVEIEYEWSVDVGKIVSGQGTPTISVSTDPSADVTVNVTVVIKGLHESCADTASDAGIVCACVEPILIDEFSSTTYEDILNRLDNLLVRLDADPNATGYIINYGSAKNIKSREKLFKDHFKHRKYDLSRIIFVNGGEEKEIRTRIWIIPAGADPSAILIGKRPYEPNCPAISITPPPNALSADEPYVFVANVSDEKDRDKLTYNWFVDKGKIIEGQGTKTIKVSAKDLKDTAINAS
jgi:hypothetical protein